MCNKNVWLWRGLRIAIIVVLGSVSGPALSQSASEPATSPATPPSKFTDQELTELWYKTFSSPQYLQSGPDFKGTIPLCLDGHDILQQKTSKILATLKLVKIIPGPVSNPGFEQQYMYIFDTRFQNIQSNPLFQYWFRQFRSDVELEPKNISRIAVLVGILWDNKDKLTAVKIDPAMEFFVYSSWDVVNMPQNSFNDFMIFDGFGFDVGYTISPGLSVCS